MALRTISTDPSAGDAQVDDLAGIRVSKFSISDQLCILSYRILDEQCLKLIMQESHENFYRNIKRLSN